MLLNLVLPAWLYPMIFLVLSYLKLKSKQHIQSTPDSAVSRHDVQLGVCLDLWIPCMLTYGLGTKHWAPSRSKTNKQGLPKHTTTVEAVSRR